MAHTDKHNGPSTGKRENLLANLAFSIAIPTLVLTRLSGERWLGPAWGLVVALASPLGYFCYDYLRRRKANFISLIGTASVLATGVLGLLKVGGLWFAAKEAVVPSVIGLGVVLSTRSRRPLVKELLLNEDVIDVAKVTAAIEERRAWAEFDALLRSSGYLLAAGFLAAGAVNFTLVRTILTADPGTEAFNAQLGRIHLLGWPVVLALSLVLTGYALWRLLSGLKRLTGLDYDDLFHEEAQPRSGAGDDLGSEAPGKKSGLSRRADDEPT